METFLTTLQQSNRNMAAEKRKRQDVQPSSKKRKKDDNPTHKVRLDNLTWKPIELEGRLDDYEGFFGLEEIDDVEVVRDGKTGVVSFHSGQDDSVQDEVQHGDHTDEFLGFSDEEPKSKPKPAKKKEKQKGIKTQVPIPSDCFATVLDDVETEPDVDIAAWRALNLSPDTLAGISKLGFSKPTAIQKAVIPEILAGHNVIGKASTGSGKTLAFGIPLFEKYLEQKQMMKKKKGILALVITPTRELAHQINQHLLDLSNGLTNEHPSIVTLTGGLSIQKQQRQIKYADIIVGTPGRLWEVISGSHDLIDEMKKIQYLVLDEADRLLSQGHFKELEEILNILDTSKEEEAEDKNQKQTLVFSATFQKDLQNKLSNRSNSTGTDMEYLIKRLKFGEKPKFIDVDPVKQMVSGLKEGLVECAGTDKDLYLYAVHVLHPTMRTLIFVNSISSVRRIVPFLQNLGLSALPLHSQMIQKARLRSIEKFKSSKTTILIATDVAARGLDIPNIDLVVHYHLPRTSDAYIHRSGRTARAGHTGSSIILCSPDEIAGVRRLVARVHVSTQSKTGMIQSLDIDRRIVQKLRPRTNLAKRISDIDAAKEKKHSRDESFKQAAEDLGVEYDSEEFDKQSRGRTGRGAGRKDKERKDREINKDEVRGMRMELKSLLQQRVNVGVSLRYPTSGSIDIDHLLTNDNEGHFLGHVQSLDI